MTDWTLVDSVPTDWIDPELCDEEPEVEVPEEEEQFVRLSPFGYVQGPIYFSGGIDGGSTIEIIEGILSLRAIGYNQGPIRKLVIVIPPDPEPDPAGGWCGTDWIDFLSPETFWSFETGSLTTQKRANAVVEDEFAKLSIVFFEFESEVGVTDYSEVLAAQEYPTNVGTDVTDEWELATIPL